MDGRVITVDIRRIVRNWIVAGAVSAGLQTHFGNPLRIGSKLDPTQAANLPAARLSMPTATSPVPDWLVASVIEVDVWAGGEEASFDAAAALQAHMHNRDILGTHAGLGVVTALETAQGLRVLDDEDAPTLDRHLFAVRYYAHPLPQ